VYVVDEGYAMPLAVSLRSLADTVTDTDALTVTILTPGLSDETVGKLRASCPGLTPRVVTVPLAALAELPVIEYWSTTVYLRLLIPMLVPGDDPILALDADTLILTDPSPLARTSLAGRPVAAIHDPVRPTFHDRGDSSHWADHGIPPGTPFFAAGTLLIDPTCWRSRRVSTRSLEYIRGHRDVIETPDEEALNVVLCGQWQPLDPHWGVLSVVAGAVAVARRLKLAYQPPEDHARALAHPGIIHFPGVDKPWTRGAMHGPYCRDFYRCLDRTAWSGWRPQ
jgi:lipopolysaccharide biosynthesis glycosyltransferase